MNDLDIEKKKYMKQKKKTNTGFTIFERNYEYPEGVHRKGNPEWPGSPIVYHEATRPQRRSERENLLANGSAESSDELRMK